MLKEMPIKTTKILFFIFEGGEYKSLLKFNIGRLARNRHSHKLPVEVRLE